MLSVYVVCWIFLQTFQTYFCIQANSVEPDQTAPRGAIWSGSTLFAKMTLKITSRWQSRRKLLWLAVLGLKYFLPRTFHTFQLQNGKRVFGRYANSEDPDQLVHLPRLPCLLTESFNTAEGAICMKWQSIFAVKNKKRKNFKNSSAEFFT